MAFKVFIDANVLLDFTLKRENYPIAKVFFASIVEGKINAFISPSILHIAIYWLTKAYGSNKTKTILLTLLSEIKIIDAPHEAAVLALHSAMKDIEEALQYYTALHHKMDYFISQDKLLKRSSIPSLPVYTLEEFIANMG